MNRTTSSLLGAAIALACVMPAPVSAQDTTRTKTDSAAGRSGMKFDPTLAVTLTGVTIVRVEAAGAAPMGAMNGGGRGPGSVHAVVQSGSDSITVTLAPAEYLASKQLALAAGDVIDVAGVPMAMDGRKTLLATTVTKGGTTVPLRDKATGRPVWAPAGTGANTPPAAVTPPMPTPPIR